MKILKHNYFSIAASALLVVFLTVGCNTTPADNESNNTDNTDTVDDHSGHDHASADHSAPNGGHLIELGRSHEYHAEFLDDHKTGKATIFIYDGDIKPLKIDQASVSLTITAGDDTATFELVSAVPGGASEFSSNEPKLMNMIDSGEIKGKLRATIKDKPMTGTFEHHPHGDDGDDHDHAH